MKKRYYRLQSKTTVNGKPAEEFLQRVELPPGVTQREMEKMIAKLAEEARALVARV